MNNDGSWATVVSVAVQSGPLQAFNLTVQDYATYFVAANENAAPVWVHNCPEVSDYGFKHASPKNVPWKKVVSGTKNGPAKFSPGIDIKSTTQSAWKDGIKVNNGKNWKVYDNVGMVGAKNGKETNYMRVEQAPDGQVHGHPISKEEFDKLTE